ncbi:uncharacterized protein LOC126327191 [Schistocerca gregaria]|uniref:uncharacterized protein LOC126327191 n=1 Tax=Schistocerca gregaria TaxID=7010 RepID=UPI00211E2964|nr:uncharacterized protein LOC126327191 [Schistocerca gregaria]
MSSEQKTPTLCRNNCGFYGASQWDNYCSKCYAQLFGTSLSKNPLEHSSEKSSVRSRHGANGGKVSSPISTKNFNNNSLKLSNSCSPESDDKDHLDMVVMDESPSRDADAKSQAPKFLDSESNGDRDAKKKRNTCAAQGCKKRLTLTSVECRCGLVFCSTHRYAEQHNCPFDYKSSKQNLLYKANPLVAPSKINEI